MSMEFTGSISVMVCLRMNLRRRECLRLHEHEVSA